jgi:hypothetical protein
MEASLQKYSKVRSKNLPKFATRAEELASELGFPCAASQTPQRAACPRASSLSASAAAPSVVDEAMD